MKNSERILRVAKLNGGIITTQQVNDMKIHRNFLRIMVEQGLLERSARGVYLLLSEANDEFYNLHIRFKKGVFSNISALHLLGFTESIVTNFDMTFPASYNTATVKTEVNAHRVKKELYELGIIPVKTPLGNEVYTYCIERTLCDILRSRNAVNAKVIAEAYQKYAQYRKKNVSLFLKYAKATRVEAKAKQYLDLFI